MATNALCVKENRAYTYVVGIENTLKNRTQNPVGATSWGFDSPLRHQ